MVYILVYGLYLDLRFSDYGLGFIFFLTAHKLAIKKNERRNKRKHHF